MCVCAFGAQQTLSRPQSARSGTRMEATVTLGSRPQSARAAIHGGGTHGGGGGRSSSPMLSSTLRSRGRATGLLLSEVCQGVLPSSMSTACGRNVYRCSPLGGLPFSLRGTLLLVLLPLTSTLGCSCRATSIPMRANTPEASPPCSNACPLPAEVPSLVTCLPCWWRACLQSPRLTLLCVVLHPH